jgi:hypothetical protein
MKNLKLYALFIIALASFSSCEDNAEALDTNYVTFAETEYAAGVDVGGSNTVAIKVFTANLQNSDRSFEVSIDTTSTAAMGSYTVPATIVVPGGQNEGILTVTLTDTDLGIGVNSLVLNFAAKEGLSNGGQTTVNYIQNCSEVTATLQINFDGYASETSWEITDSLGGVLASVAAGTYSDGLASVTETVTLCAGRDFSLTIGDSYGDGLTYPSLGSYSVTVNSVEVVSEDGAYGTGETTTFDTK